MSEDKAASTLLQMAGAKPSPGSMSESTVLLIDAQREYVDGRLPLDGIGPALEALSGLLKRARAENATIIHVVHKGRAGGLFDPQASGSQVVAAANPALGERVVEKMLPNAFAGTDLDAILKASGRQSLIIAGFATHMCVSSTVRAALDLGYKTTVVADATATRALPEAYAGTAAASDLKIVPAGDVQRAALAALADRFATVVPLAALPS